MKLKTEKPVMLLIFSIFYMIVGGAYAFILVASNFMAPPHIGVLAFLSFVTAYGLIQMRKRAVLLTTVLFFLGAASSIPVLAWLMTTQTLSSSFGALLFTSLIIYIVLSLSTAMYAAAKREKFK